MQAIKSGGNVQVGKQGGDRKGLAINQDRPYLYKKPLYQDLYYFTGLALYYHSSLSGD